MIEKKKILFIIPTIEGGGAERVLSTILNNIDYDKFAISCVLFENKIGYSIPIDKINIIDMNLPGDKRIVQKFLLFFKRYSLLRKIYKSLKPDIVFSFMSTVNLLAIISTITFKNIKLYISVHNTTSVKQIKIQKKMGFLYDFLIRVLYPMSDKIIAVSKGIQEDLIVNYKIAPNKILVIYNPVDIDYIDKLKYDNKPSVFSGNVPCIINIGSLIEQKGQQYLIGALKIVKEKIDCRLVILGQGREHTNLMNYAKKCGVEDSVIFTGFQTNPYSFLNHADVFVLSSLWEGFGVVIIEAMACGVPVISTRCPSGPDEIIEDEHDGLLVKVADEVAIAEAIERVLSNKAFANELKTNALKKAELFSVKGIIKEYESLFSA
jgi:glycosyltransferase involved in cell wall biosynthesis